MAWDFSGFEVVFYYNRIRSVHLDWEVPDHYSLPLGGVPQVFIRKTFLWNPCCWDVLTLLSWLQKKTHLIKNWYIYNMYGLVAQMVKNLPAVQETWVWSLGWEDALEKGTATHSSFLAWKTPRTEEPGGLQSVGSQRVRHDRSTNISTCTANSLRCSPETITTLLMSYTQYKIKNCFNVSQEWLISIIHFIFKIPKIWPLLFPPSPSWFSSTSFHHWVNTFAFPITFLVSSVICFQQSNQRNNFET